MHLSPIVSAVEYGWYINLWKILPLLVFLMIWTRLLTWADKDAEAAHLPRIPLNLAFLSGLILGVVLFLFLPGFLIGLSAFIVIMIVEVSVYLLLRHQKVGLHDLSKQFKTWVHSLTSREKEVKVEAGEVMLMNKKGTPMAPPEADSPELAGYKATQELLTDPLRRGAERIELRPSEGAASVKYTVDGMPMDGRSIPRDDAAAAVTLIKKLAGLDQNEKRKPQAGSIRTGVDGKKSDLQVVTAGSTTGEALSIEVNPKSRHDQRVDELGLSDEQFNTLEETVAEGEGIVLLAAPKGHGLTSLLYAVLRRHDAFLSHIQTIERSPSQDLEGITQNEVAAKAPPAEEAKQVAWVTSQDPDVLMIDRVEDPKSAMDLIKYANSGKRAYIGIRAGSTFEALEQWRALVGDDKLAVKPLRLVVAGRLVRKLCVACKMDYNPDPETLRRLNMSPEKVGKLFTARTTPLRDQRGHEMVCEFCLDMHFKGRTGVYEMFTIDDEVRQVVMAGGSINQLKMLFKKQRQRYLQENALARAVAGDTSLQEVVRVLRSGETAAKPAVKK